MSNENCETQGEVEREKITEPKHIFSALKKSTLKCIQK